MQTDAELAFEALAGGLACECGLINETVWPTGYPRNYVHCTCGVHYKLFKKKGWLLTKRSLKAWRAREKALLAKIAELDAQYQRIVDEWGPLHDA